MATKRRSAQPTHSVNGSATADLTVPHVAIYMRVSSEDQAERETIDAQRYFLRQFTNLYGLPVADEYADDGITGTLPLGERPEGRRLIQDAEAHRFGCVLVTRLTRLGRSLKALTDAHDVLSQFGVTIRSANEPFDTSTPIGKFVFQLLGSLAELDRAQILDQLTQGRDRVARKGKWTGGLVPFGYVTNVQGCLVPSEERVDALGMTEAQMVYALYERIAAGSSSIAEATRLNALGVPLIRRYSNGRRRTYGTKWHPNIIVGMINNPTYRGTHVLDSRYGAIERDVPSLVDADIWTRANAQIQRNRRLPKSNATRTYLLRGLITCGKCGSTYVGQVNTRRQGGGTWYYRCKGNNLTHDTDHQKQRCTARVIKAKWLEGIVWDDCRTFICNPGDALAEAQHQLHDRMAQVAHMEDERSRALHALHEKARERDRIMTLFRHGRVALQEAEKHLDEIAKEEATLRQQLSAMDAQKALAEAVEAHMTDASLLLHRLQERVTDIDQMDDQATKRQVIELLVHGIRIDTLPNKELTATITYAFTPERVANFSTASSREGAQYVRRL